MRHTMRHDSANDGGASSVAIASSDAPIARRSWAPRTGSWSRKASTTKTKVGMANRMNGARQPQA